jgi:hypothetical protein
MAKLSLDRFDRMTAGCGLAGNGMPSDRMMAQGPKPKHLLDRA